MFYRVLNVAMLGKLIQNLRIDFDITQTTREDDDEPDGGEIRVYNLAPVSRKFFNKIGSPVTLNAGHLDNLPAPIFNGELVGYEEEREGADIISVFKVEDRGLLYGSLSLEKVKMSFSFPPGATALTVCAAIAAWGATPLASVPVKDHVFLSGFSFSGTLAKALDIIIKDVLDSTWYVNDKKLYTQSSDAVNVGIPFVVSKETGLIGRVGTSKEKDKNDTEITYHSFTALITPRVYVGQPLTVIDAETGINAGVKITELHKYGGNMVNDFYCDFVGRVL